MKNLNIPRERLAKAKKIKGLTGYINRKQWAALLAVEPRTIQSWKDKGKLPDGTVFPEVDYKDAITEHWLEATLFEPTKNYLAFKEAKKKKS